MPNPTRTEVMALMEELRAADAEWQARCDGWIKLSVEAGQPVNAEQQAIMRRTRDGRAADALTRLVEEPGEEEVRRAATGLVNAEREEHGLEPVGFHQLWPGDQERYRKRARAALQAIRGEG